MFFVVGTLAIIIIALMIAYVYVHRPKYGIYLIIVVFILIAGFTSWSLLEPKLEDKKASKIIKSEVSLSNQTLKPAYGNRYLYQAEFNNLSSSNRLTSVVLALQIACEQSETNCTIQSSSKEKSLWLKPGESKTASVYFDIESLATEIKDREWRVSIVSIRAK